MKFSALAPALIKHRADSNSNSGKPRRRRRRPIRRRRLRRFTTS
jgi:hypothetical protein